jgi:hypothetical protein
MHECVVMTGARITIEFGPSPLIDSYRVGRSFFRVFTSVQRVLSVCRRHVCTGDAAMPVIYRCD